MAQPLIAAIETGTRAATPATRGALVNALALRPSTALRARREQLLAAIARLGGTDPMAIGSVARGTDTPGSDLDLVIAFPPDTSIIDVLALEEELGAILTLPVDVISARSSGLTGRIHNEAIPA